MTEIHVSDVTIISVCYRSESVIAELVGSVPAECSVILVDNGSETDFSALPDGKKIDIVRMPENIGFGSACNVGASKLKTSWIFFLNPDTLLKSDTITKLVEAANKFPDASAFNPRIETSDRREYFKRRSYLIPRREFMQRGWPDTDCQIPVLSGAAIFISKSVFERVGGFDPNIFLYHEDDDLSLRLRELGPLMFIRDSVLTHKGGSSSDRTPEVAFFKAFHLAQSRMYTGRKHGKKMVVLSTKIESVLKWLDPTTYLYRRRFFKALGFLKGSNGKTIK